MKIAIGQVEDLMKAALAVRKIPDADASFIISDYIDAELEGHRTHGIGKFLLIDNALRRRRGTPEIIGAHGAMARIDGNGDLGHIVARLASLTAIDLANSCGIGIVSIRNFSRFSRLAPYVNHIAEHGLIGIAANNAGPPAVAPYGSRDPILGTNPIAFGFPCDPSPVVIDFATSRHVWGEIRQAQLAGRPLPPNAFLDDAGNATINPESVNAVLPFGDAKGSALCLAIELLMGSVGGVSMGLRVADEYDLGAMFIAVEAANGSSSAVADLLTDVRASAPLVVGGQVRAPGDRSRAERLANRASGDLDVDERTLGILQGMASGEVGLAANNLNN